MAHVSFRLDIARIYIHNAIVGKGFKVRAKNCLECNGLMVKQMLKTNTYCENVKKILKRIDSKEQADG